jgi:ketosteroid isomerase-like protein
MASAGEVVRQFYQAAQKKDLAAARKFLSEDLVFVGLFETYRGPGEYLAALTGLLGITVRLDVLTLISEGDQAAIFFELETVAPAAATTLVAEWHQVRDGRIHRVKSAFDGRPFEAMFKGG